MPKVTLSIFLAAVVIMAVIIFQPAVQSIDTQTSGERFLFETAPLDPYDPFRGKYVQLSFQQREALCTDTSENILRGKAGKKVYGLLKVRPDGTAEVAEIVLKQPTSGTYLTLKTAHSWRNSSSSMRMIDFSFPFDRFYMNEKLAPRAEQLYRSARTDSTKAVLAVYVKNGHAVIDDLLLNGVSITKAAAEDENKR